MSELIGAGADAMSNMYEVAFTFPRTVASTPITDITKLRIRADGFTPPSDSQQTYEVHWKTVSLTRPAAKIVMDRQFSITFRVDANWDLYKSLLKWKAKTSIGSVGYASQQLPDGGVVEVKALGGAINALSEVASSSGDTPSIATSSVFWKYEDVWIESITNPDFSTENGEPAKVTAVFRFSKFTDASTPSTV